MKIWPVFLTRRGGSLSVESHLGGPYCDINSCSFLMMVSAVLEDVLWMNGFAKCVYQ